MEPHGGALLPAGAGSGVAGRSGSESGAELGVASPDVLEVAGGRVAGHAGSGVAGRGGSGGGTSSGDGTPEDCSTVAPTKPWLTGL